MARPARRHRRLGTCAAPGRVDETRNASTARCPHGFAAAGSAARADRRRGRSRCRCRPPRRGAGPRSAPARACDVARRGESAGPTTRQRGPCPRPAATSRPAGPCAPPRAAGTGAGPPARQRHRQQPQRQPSEHRLTPRAPGGRATSIGSPSRPQPGALPPRAMRPG